jgi:hypothetical protein
MSEAENKQLAQAIKLRLYELGFEPLDVNLVSYGPERVHVPRMDHEAGSGILEFTASCTMHPTHVELRDNHKRAFRDQFVTGAAEKLVSDWLERAECD